MAEEIEDQSAVVPGAHEIDDGSFTDLVSEDGRGVVNHWLGHLALLAAMRDDFQKSYLRQMDIPSETTQEETNRRKAEWEKTIDELYQSLIEIGINKEKPATTFMAKEQFLNILAYHDIEYTDHPVEYTERSAEVDGVFGESPKQTTIREIVEGIASESKSILFHIGDEATIAGTSVSNEFILLQKMDGDEWLLTPATRDAQDALTISQETLISELARNSITGLTTVPGIRSSHQVTRATPDYVLNLRQGSETVKDKHSKSAINKLIQYFNTNPLETLSKYAYTGELDTLYKAAGINIRPMFEFFVFMHSICDREDCSVLNAMAKNEHRENEKRAITQLQNYLESNPRASLGDHVNNQEFFESIGINQSLAETIGKEIMQLCQRRFDDRQFLFSTLNNTNNRLEKTGVKKVLDYFYKNPLETIQQYVGDLSTLLRQASVSASGVSKERTYIFAEIESAYQREDLTLLQAMSKEKPEENEQNAIQKLHDYLKANANESLEQYEDNMTPLFERADIDRKFVGTIGKELTQISQNRKLDKVLLSEILTEYGDSNHAIKAGIGEIIEYLKLHPLESINQHVDNLDALFEKLNIGKKQRHQIRNKIRSKSDNDSLKILRAMLQIEDKKGDKKNELQVIQQLYDYLNTNRNESLAKYKGNIAELFKKAGIDQDFVETVGKNVTKIWSQREFDKTILEGMEDELIKSPKTAFRDQQLAGIRKIIEYFNTHPFENLHTHLYADSLDELFNQAGLTESANLVGLIRIKMELACGRDDLKVLKAMMESDYGENEKKAIQNIRDYLKDHPDESLEDHINNFSYFFNAVNKEVNIDRLSAEMLEKRITDLWKARTQDQQFFKTALNTSDLSNRDIGGGVRRIIQYFSRQPLETISDYSDNLTRLFEKISFAGGANPSDVLSFFDTYYLKADGSIPASSTKKADKLVRPPKRKRGKEQEEVESDLGEENAAPRRSYRKTSHQSTMREPLDDSDIEMTGVAPERVRASEESDAEFSIGSDAEDSNNLPPETAEEPPERRSRQRGGKSADPERGKVEDKKLSKEQEKLKKNIQEKTIAAEAAITALGAIAQKQDRLLSKQAKTAVENAQGFLIELVKEEKSLDQFNRVDLFDLCKKVALNWSYLSGLKTFFSMGIDVALFPKLSILDVDDLGWSQSDEQNKLIRMSEEGRRGLKLSNDSIEGLKDYISKRTIEGVTAIQAISTLGEIVHRKIPHSAKGYVSAAGTSVNKAQKELIKFVKESKSLDKFNRDDLFSLFKAVVTGNELVSGAREFFLQGLHVGLFPNLSKLDIDEIHWSKHVGESGGVTRKTDLRLKDGVVIETYKDLKKYIEIKKISGVAAIKALVGLVQKEIPRNAKGGVTHAGSAVNQGQKFLEDFAKEGKSLDQFDRDNLFSLFKKVVRKNESVSGIKKFILKGLDVGLFPALSKLNVDEIKWSKHAGERGGVIRNTADVGEIIDKAPANLAGTSRRRRNTEAVRESDMNSLLSELYDIPGSVGSQFPEEAEERLRQFSQAALAAIDEFVNTVSKSSTLSPKQLEFTNSLRNSFELMLDVVTGIYVDTENNFKNAVWKLDRVPRIESAETNVDDSPIKNCFDALRSAITNANKRHSGMVIELSDDRDSEAFEDSAVEGVSQPESEALSDEDSGVDVEETENEITTDVEIKVESEDEASNLQREVIAGRRGVQVQGSSLQREVGEVLRRRRERQTSNSTNPGRGSRGNKNAPLTYRPAIESDARIKKRKPNPNRPRHLPGDGQRLVKYEHHDDIGEHEVEYQVRQGGLELVRHVNTRVNYDEKKDTEFFQNKEFYDENGKSIVSAVECKFEGDDLTQIQKDVMHWFNAQLAEDTKFADLPEADQARITKRIEEIEKELSEQLFNLATKGQSPFAGKFKREEVQQSDVDNGADPSTLGVLGVKKISKSHESGIEVVGPVMGKPMSQEEVDDLEGKYSDRAISEYLGEIEPGRYLFIRNLAGFFNTSGEFDPSTGSFEYGNSGSGAVFRNATVKIKTKVNDVEQEHPPFKWQAMLGFGLQKNQHIPVNYQEAYKGILNRHLLPSLLEPYKQASIGSWLESYKKNVEELLQAKADPIRLRDRVYLAPMVEAKNRANPKTDEKPGLNAEVFDSIDDLRRHVEQLKKNLSALPADGWTRCMVNVSQDHFVGVNLHINEKGQFNIQVLESTGRTDYMVRLESALCKNRDDLITQFQLRTQKLARGCVGFSLQLLEDAYKDRKTFQRLADIRRAGYDIPQERQQVEGEEFDQAKSRKQTITDCRFLLGPKYFINMNDEGHIQEAIEENAKRGYKDWGTELRELQNERVKALGLTSYEEDCVVAKREVHTQLMPLTKKTMEKANLLFEHERLALVNLAIQEVQLSQQPHEKRLKKDYFAVTDALTIVSAADPEQAKALLATQREAKEIRAIERFLETTKEPLQVNANVVLKRPNSILIRRQQEIRAALPGGLVLRRKKPLHEKPTHYNLVKEEPREEDRGIESSKAYKNARKRQYDYWNDLHEAYKEAITTVDGYKDDRTNPRFKRCIEAFISYANRNLTVQEMKSPQDLAAAMKKWKDSLITSPLKSDRDLSTELNNKVPSPWNALSNLAKVQYPGYRFAVDRGRGIAERVLKDKKAQIDEMERLHEAICRGNGLSSAGYRNHVKFVFSVLLEATENDNPFNDFKGKLLNRVKINKINDKFEKECDMRGIAPEVKKQYQQILRRVLEILQTAQINMANEKPVQQPTNGQSAGRAKGKTR
ncbi:MAG: YopJ family acetyltransferase [Pseudomonadota bacterium]